MGERTELDRTMDHVPPEAPGPNQAGGDVTLSFPSTTGFTYHVEYKTALNTSAWTPLTTRAGNGSTQTVSDSNPGGQARFYRLRVE